MNPRRPFRGPVARLFCLVGIVITLFLVMAPLAVVVGDDDLPPTRSVKPELYATGFAFAEGPALDSAGNLYVVNYRHKGTIGRITHDGKASIWCDLNELVPIEGRQAQANGLKVDGEERLIVADAGCGRVLRISADGKQVEILADRCEGARFVSINDVALDEEGSIYFSDPGGSSADNPIGSVYRYDIQTKKTSLLVTGLAFPNGVGVTPDQQHLCIAESQQFRILIFDLDRETGKATSKRVLIAFPADSQGDIAAGKFPPDGLVFDAKGRLYVAMWVGGAINVVDVPSGRLLRQYDAGGSQATNCHFHGPYLYTTVAAKEAVFRLKLNVAGHQYAVRSSVGVKPIEVEPENEGR